MAELFDIGIFSVEDIDGSIGVGWKLAFYATGTTTPQNTYPTEADADAGTNANTNPVISDAGGRFPPIWMKSTGPSYKAVLSDEFDVVRQTRDPGFFSIFRVLAGPTGLNLIGNGTDIVLGSAEAQLDVPVGNPYAPTYTKLSLKMYGDDPLLASSRAFTFMAGVDNRGQAGTDNVHDMVAGYFGAKASAYTSGDGNTVRKPIWAINTVTVLDANSGTYNSRGIETDFSNSVRNIGSGDGSAYTSEVIACGIEIFHSGPFSSTAAVLVNVGSDGSLPFYRGFAVAPGAAAQAGFADYSNATYSFDSRGSHAYGLHLTGTYTTGHVVKGSLSVGQSGSIIPDPESGITLDVWGAARLRAFLNVLGVTNLEGGLGVTLDGTLKAVSVGANDSGGSGFKVLRIPN